MMMVVMVVMVVMVTLMYDHYTVKILIFCYFILTDIAILKSLYLSGIVSYIYLFFNVIMFYTEY